MSFKVNIPDNHCYNCPSDCEINTQSGLAITPSRMVEMVNQGIPVSTDNASGQYYDGIPMPSFDIPIDQRRGVDIAQIWQAQQSARSKISHNLSNLTSLNHE